MPIVSAVMTVVPSRKDALLRELAERPELELGPPAGLRIPVVIDTVDRAHDKQAWKRLETTVGVLALDLVFADFSDLHAQEGS